MKHQHQKLALGPFELDRQIGKGGMGEVWRGVHMREGKPVAIKVIFETTTVEDTHQVAFEREVHAAASMAHPEIVQVFDYGRLPAHLETRSKGRLKTDSPYLVMAWANGGSVEEHPPTDWASLREIILSILRALAHAHAKEMVHLDIKPANVLLLRQDDTVRYQLSDFGIAFAFSAHHSEANQLRASTIMGTPSYMAPEQFLGRWRAFGPWTDLYALGCMVFELLHHYQPFDAPSLLTLATAHLFEPLPLFSPQFTTPAGLETWLERMTAKAPHQRFQCAADAAYALLQLDATVDDPAPSHHTAKLTEAWTTYRGSGTQRLFEHDGNTHTLVIEHLQHTGELAFDETMDSAQMPKQQLGMDTLQQDDPWEVIAPLPVETQCTDAPPCPIDWRLPQDTDDASQPTLMFGTGLSIWGLRSLPFVGREKERDFLWAQLVQSHQTGHGRFVALSGLTGHGKSYLCHWLIERARELGSAITLSARHHKEAGYLDGLGAMLAAHTQCVGLDREKTYERIRLQLQRCAPDAQKEDIQRQAGALTQWMHPATHETQQQDNVPAVHFATQEERFEAICQWLKHHARHRVTLMVLEDIHHSNEAIEFAQYCVDALKVHRVMVVCTIQEDRIGAETAHHQQLSALTEHARVSTLRLGPLERHAHEHMVSKLLGLAPKEVQRVCDWTEGDPLFAVQLVEDWVEQSKLILGPEGFCLADEQDIEIPSNVSQLCARRLHYVVTQSARKPDITQDDAEPQDTSIWSMLELAAVLGSDVRDDEWRRVCELSHLSASQDLVRVLVNQGIAQRTRDGWKFNNRVFVEQLHQHARANDRLKTHHRRCAHMLIGPNTAPQQSLLERAGYHALAGGDIEGALAAFKDVIVMVSITRSAQIIRDIESALESIDEASARPLRTQLILHGHFPILMYQGELQQAQTYLNGLAGDIPNAPTETQIEYGLACAKLCLYDQRYDEGLQHVDGVLQQLNTHHTIDTHELRGRCARLNGELLMFNGDLSLARKQFDMAMTHFGIGKHAWRLAWAMHCMGMCLLDLGEFEQARQIIHQCKATMTQCGDRAGSAACEDNLAILAYEEGRYEDALISFARAIEDYESTQDAGVWISRENYARCLIKLERYEEARERLKIIQKHNDGLESNVFVNYIQDALLCCYVGLRDKTAFHSTYLIALSQLHKEAHVDELMIDSFREALKLLIDAQWEMESQALGEILVSLCKREGFTEILADIESMMR